MKKFYLAIISLAFSFCVFAQIDTTSFPKERAEIRALMSNRKPDLAIDCSDFIAVGPKGDISFSREQWQQAQQKEKLVFKSVQVLPENVFIRIYEGNMAVVNFLADVRLLVDGHDVNIKVRRLEIFHKSQNRWCRVAGQGTEVDEKLFPVK